MMNLIPPQYYKHIYFILISILSIAVFSKYSRYGSERFAYQYNDSELVPVIFLATLLILLIGFRPISGRYFYDMANYVENYWGLRDPNYSWTWNTTNKIFDNFFYLLSAKEYDIYVFFVLMALLNFGGLAVACCMLFPKDKMASFIVYLAAFSTFSYATNGLKAGVAASLFLIALAFDERKNKLWTLFFILLSWGFHHSMQLPVIAFVICKIFKNPKYYIYFWLICFVMAAGHVTFFMGIFEGMTDEQGAIYLSGATEETIKGFRLDFIIYSAAPILIGYIALKKKMIVSKKYEFLLNLYTFVNAIWLLCMYAEFTNRISYLSWFMLPVVLIYPLLKEKWGYNQYIVFRGVAYGHLCFTLFMMYIYYGLIRG